MTDTTDEPDLPTNEALETAIAAAKQGELGPEEFASSLRASTLLLAVAETTELDEQQAALPLVIEVEGTDYGVAFTSVQHWQDASTQAPFMLLEGPGLAQQWPPGLGLAINPQAGTSILLSPDNLQQLFGTRPPEHRSVPAGATITVGAPDPGLPPEALEALRAAVRADEGVLAAYELALAVDDGPVELVVGVEAAPSHDTVAQRFSEQVSRADPGFVGIAFVDLDDALLELARDASAPLA